jgi:hypothetical protein
MMSFQDGQAVAPRGAIRITANPSSNARKIRFIADSSSFDYCTPPAGEG